MIEYKTTMKHKNLDSIIWDLKYLSSDELNKFINAIQLANKEYLERLQSVSINDKIFIDGNFGDYHECIVQEVNLKDRHLVVIEPNAFGMEKIRKEIIIFKTLEEFRNLRIF